MGYAAIKTIIFFELIYHVNIVNDVLIFMQLCNDLKQKKWYYGFEKNVDELAQMNGCDFVSKLWLWDI